MRVEQSGALRASGSPAAHPERVPVRLAPGKVSQESERPEASKHVARSSSDARENCCQSTPGSTSSPNSEKAGSCALR